jgi:hypothetical protein
MRRLFIAFLLIAGAAVVGIMHRGAAETVVGGHGVDVKDEIRQSYRLRPDASVRVTAINGTVDIDTVDSDQAEVYIERSARSQEDLQGSISIEQTADGLAIRGTRHNAGFWRRIWGGEVRQNVSLKLPRTLSVSVHGVNGAVHCAALDGPVQVSGVNGSVDLAQTAGYSEITGVNGRVSVGVKQLDARGMHVSGVNGGVELRLADGLNADINGNGVNGIVKSEAPDIAVERLPERARFTARVGSGGAAITIAGVNGGVHLVPFDTKSEASSQAKGEM